MVKEEDFETKYENQNYVLEQAKGRIEVTYSINRYTYKDGSPPTYDWSVSSGDDSDEWFDSAEEAEDDVRSHLGG